MFHLYFCPHFCVALFQDVIVEFMFAIPKARAPPPLVWCGRPDVSAVRAAANAAFIADQAWYERSGALHTARVRQQLFFPDRRLIQFDCGKLQELAVLLRRLKSGGHRVLIFTQARRQWSVHVQRRESLMHPADGVLCACAVQS